MALLTHIHVNLIIILYIYIFTYDVLNYIFINVKKNNHIILKIFDCIFKLSNFRNYFFSDYQF